MSSSAGPGLASDLPHQYRPVWMCLTVVTLTRPAAHPGTCSITMKCLMIWALLNLVTVSESAPLGSEVLWLLRAAPLPAWAWAAPDSSDLQLPESSLLYMTQNGENLKPQRRFLSILNSSRLHCFRHTFLLQWSSPWSTPCVNVEPESPAG